MSEDFKVPEEITDAHKALMAALKKHYPDNGLAVMMVVLDTPINSLVHMNIGGKNLKEILLHNADVSEALIPSE